MRSFIAFLFVIATFVGVQLPTSGPAEAQCSCTKSRLAMVKEKGVVRAGVRKDVQNFGFIDDKGNLAGFDIDIAQAVADKLGVKLELEAVSTTMRVPMLQSGRIDMIVATLTHYRKRDNGIDFSVGYFKDTGTVMVKKASGIKTLADLTGKRLSSATGAEAPHVVQKIQPQVKVQTFESYAESFLALQQGLVDGVVSDVMMLAGLRLNAPNPADYVFITGEKAQFGGGEYAIGVAENDSAWRDAINHALFAIWEDGTWDRIYDKWIGKDSKLKIAKEELNWRMNVTSP